MARVTWQGSFRRGFILVIPVLGVLLTVLGSTAGPGSEGQTQNLGRRWEFSKEGRPKYVPGEALIRFKPGTPVSSKWAAHTDAGAAATQSLEIAPDLERVRLPAGLSVRTVIAAYRKNPDVLFAEPNFILHSLSSPNDPSFSQQWALQNLGQLGGVPGADIHATQAWNVTTGSSNVVVGVIDTGIDYNHQDLSANTWSSPSSFSFSLNGTNLNCGVGTHGINTVARSCDPLDDHSHGSHVSGTIGAVGNNGVGVAGVNWNVGLMACKFLDATGSGTTADAVACLNFIKQMHDSGVPVVATSNSWGGPFFDQALADAITAQMQDGILFVAAAGNSFSDNVLAPEYPASFAIPNILSVAATTRFDTLANFSNFGRSTVHLGAPGQHILSTTPKNTYSIFSGTSMATPHVAGVAALLKAHNPALDWRGIKNLILAGGDSIPSLAETITGRRLNAYSSLTCNNAPVQARLSPPMNSVPASVGQPVTLAELNINCAQPAGPVQVTVSPGGQVISLADDGKAPDQAANDGVYTGQFTPQAPGNYTLTFPGNDTVQVTVLQNYVAGGTPFNYRTISGTNLSLGDDSVFELKSPFPVQFGGGSFSNLYVSSNGTVSFTNAFGEFLNYFIPVNHFLLINPNMNGPPPTVYRPVVTLVAPFWDDLAPIPNTSHNVFWDVLGTAPNRELVIEWRDVPAFDCRNDVNATVKFQAVFSESKNDLLFNYTRTVFGGACANHDYGASATVGIQVSQNSGTQWGMDADTVGNGMSLLWTIPPPQPPPNPMPQITSISPSSVPFGTGDTVFTINGTGFVPGSQAELYPIFSRVTTYISSTQLQVLLLASDLAPIGGYPLPISIYIMNPAPGGGTTSGNFFVTAPPAPHITSISPASVPAGSFGFFLTVNGSGFLPQTSITWNDGSQFPPGFSPSSSTPTQMSFAIPGFLLRNAGTVTITAHLGDPLVSNPVTFTITPQSAPAAITAPTHNSSPPNLPGFSTSAPSAAPKPLQPPQRFLGWKYAQRRGGDYLSQFLRKRADLAPSVTSAVPMTGPSSSTTTATATAPPLAAPAFRPTLPADFLPSAVVTGDFNGDGKLDWAIANAGSNNIWLYFGNGDGTWQLPRVIPLRGFSPVALAAADMNRDGKLDLVVAEADSGAVAVLLGNGDGTFGPEQQYYVPEIPVTLVVGDFDGDGKLDVVAGMLSFNDAGPLVFLPGDGAGHLGRPVSDRNKYFLFDRILAMQAADLNGDGLLDLVVVDVLLSPMTGSFEAFPNFGATVYLNSGNGLFKRGQHFDLDNPDNLNNLPARVITTVALGDANGDGCVDAVTVDTSSVATFFPGRCNGTFDTSSRRIFGAGTPGGAAALADLDGDGKLDLIVTGFPFDDNDISGLSGGSLVSVLKGDGTGNFAAPRVFRGEPGMFSFAVADINHDGKLDLITANQDTDSASLYLNDGTGGFGGPRGSYNGYLTAGNMHAVSNAPMTPFAFVDVNGDGHQDLVFFENPDVYPLPGKFTVQLGDGKGNFGPPIRTDFLNTNDDVFDFVFGDFRNSGKSDVLLLGAEATSVGKWFLAFAGNNGNGTFSTPRYTFLNNLAPFQLVTGDFNGDGKLDVIAVNYSNAGDPSNPSAAIASLVPFLGNGDGTFTRGTAISYKSDPFKGPFIASAYAGDFNRDGKLDLLVQGSGLMSSSDVNALYEFLGNGDGTFQPPRLLFNNFGPFALADLNRDGQLDIVEQVPTQPTFFGVFRPLEYAVFLGQPDGSFTKASTYGPFPGFSQRQYLFGTPTHPERPLQPVIADFNGDGIPDIAAYQAVVGGEALGEGVISFGGTTTILQILLGNGDGTFTPTYLPASFGSFFPPQVAADATGNGRADLIEMDAQSSTYHVIPTGPGATFQIALVSDPVIRSNGRARIVLATPSPAGATLQLSASDPNITVPASVTIAAGQLSADVDFQIGPAFDVSRVFTITAQLGTEAHAAYGTQAIPGSNEGFLALYFNSNPNLIPTIAPTETISYAVLLVSLGGYRTEITPSCVGLPSTAACQFDLNPIGLSPGGLLFSTATVTTQANIPVGNYSFTIRYADGTLTQQLPAVLKVGDFTMGITPARQSVDLQSGFAQFRLAVQGLNNYGKAVHLTCSGLPPGATCSLNGQQTFPDVFALPFSIGTSGVPAGTYTFTATGTSGPIVHTATAQFVVPAGTLSGSISPGQATIPVGSSASFRVSLSASGQLNDTFSLSCVNPPAGITCSFNPSAVPVSPAAQGASTLTVSVTSRPATGAQAAQTSAGSSLSLRSRSAWFGFARLFCALALILLLLVVKLSPTTWHGLHDTGLRRVYVTPACGAMVTALVLAVLMVVVSCGGGASSSPPPPPPSPSVTVSLTIQASSSSQTQNVGTITILVP